MLSQKVKTSHSMNIDLFDKFPLSCLKFSKSIRAHYENFEQFVQLCSIIAEKKQYHTIHFNQEDARKTNFTDISIQYHSIKRINEVCYSSEMNVLKIKKTILGIRFIIIDDLDVFQKLLQSPTLYPGATLDIDIDLDYESSIEKKNLSTKNELTVLDMMIQSESPLRNLDIKYYVGNLGGMRELNISSLLRLMQFVCCGLNVRDQSQRTFNHSLWSSFLTRELYDPRMLGLIAKFAFCI